MNLFPSLSYFQIDFLNYIHRVDVTQRCNHNQSDGSYAFEQKFC